MTSAPRRQGSETRQAIHDAALASFAERGYQATSLRQLATEVGIEVASLYRHFASKEELLFTLIYQATAQFYDRLVAVVDAAGDDPVDRLRAVVRETARTHAADRSQSFLGLFELRELNTEHYEKTIAQRDEVENFVKSLIEAARDAGYYPPEVNVSITAQLLASVGSSVAIWYRHGGTLTPDDVAALAVDFAVPLRS